MLSLGIIVFLPLLGLQFIADPIVEYAFIGCVARRERKAAEDVVVSGERVRDRLLRNAREARVCLPQRLGLEPCVEELLHRDRGAGGLDRRIVENVVDLRGGVWNKKEYSLARGLKGAPVKRLQAKLVTNNGALDRMFHAVLKAKLV